MLKSNDSPRQIARLLAWYAQMGATGVLGDNPLDWRGRAEAPGANFRRPEFQQERPDQRGAGVPGPAVGRDRTATTARSVRADASAGAAAPAGRTGPAVRSFDAPAAKAPAAGRGVARPADGSTSTDARFPVAAASLTELAAALASFDGCGLKATAKSLCLYRGAERARVMVIGEAPGREEDLAGKPFVGAAGQLLDLMLAAAGFGAGAVHITNVVYWRPPGNRTPTRIEVMACQPFLDRQIALVAPDVLLVLGGVAAKQMLGIDEGIMKLRGRWREIERGGRLLRVMPTLHPAYLLRTPAAKRQAWRDLLTVAEAVEPAGG